MNWNPRQGLGLQTISMVAAALANDYKVDILLSGSIASTSRSKTTGKTTIVLPVIDLDDPNYLTLVRGYVDHEAGHVRFTDFDAIDNDQSIIGNVPVSRRDRVLMLSNIYEDIYVERKMGEYYLGCKKNFRNIAELLFCGNDSPAADVIEREKSDNMMAIELVAQYILYNVRSQVHSALTDFKNKLREVLENKLPGLADRLDSILVDIASKTTSTQANMELAVATNNIIDHYIQDMQDMQKSSSSNGESNSTSDSNQNSGDGQNSSGGQGGSTQGGMPTKETISDLCNPTVDSKAKQDTSVHVRISKDMTDILTNNKGGNTTADVKQAALRATNMLLKEADGTIRGSHYTGSSDSSSGFCMACNRLDAQLANEAVRTSCALDTQLRSLLQTFVMNKCGAARVGALDSRKLARLAVNNPRVFRTKVERQGVNTDIIILMDASGSMHGYNIKLASMALYAIMKSLRKIQGVRSSAFAFGGNEVLEVVASDSKLTDKVLMTASGGTVCGEALMAVVPKFDTTGTYDRRIVILLTDGESHNKAYFNYVLKRLHKAGVIVLGIGMSNYSIKQHITDPDRVDVINNMKELVPAMFRMLRKNIVGVKL